MAGALATALGGLPLALWLQQDSPPPALLNEHVTSAGGSASASQANPAGASGSVDSAAEEDFLTASDEQATPNAWTTSAELTAGVNDYAGLLQPETSTASASSAALSFAPSPSLSANSSEVDAAQGDAGAEATERRPSTTVTGNPNADAPNAKEFPTAPISDVMSQVASALAQAERQDDSAVPLDATAQPLANTGEPDSSNPPGRSDDSIDWAHQPPIMLTREASHLLPPTPRGVSSRAWREPRCTARLELSDEFLCEPASMQTILVGTKEPRSKDLQAKVQAGGEWRIYDKDAKSPRACIIVNVRPRSGRDFGLEWSVRGGAEDLPELRLPLARNWLDALAVQLKVTAGSLQAFVDTPSTSVPREMRSLVQQQRQYARQQIKTAERLLTLLAEVDRLAGFIDGELLAHAEVREGEGGRLLLGYGSCEPQAAESDDAGSTAD